MHIFKSMCLLKEINNVLLTNFVAYIICFDYWFCLVAQRSLSSYSTRAVVSRDTIFQSLGLEGLKPRSRHHEVSENGQVSAIFPIRA